MPKKADIHERLNVADLCVWKNKIKSGITFVIATHTWYQLVIMETRLVPFLCSTLLVLMLLLFIWVKRAPTPEEIKQKDSPVRTLFSEIEGLLLMLYEIVYEIAYEEDMKTLLWAILFVAIIYTLGSYISLLTVIYICLVCLMTIPVLYLLFQEVVDNFIEDVLEVKDKILEIFKPSRRSYGRVLY
ncbi:hypothetical protein HID58_006996 [Brassica napus]|uniref:Reticulon-like protein n=1 Tax=Brassica napus TaxID=3708 RepID=A0ABQ8EFY0_BRANA|nr:hypothetical protein HID58_006996 [Brassica napus]